MRQVTLKTKDEHRIEAVHYDMGFNKAVILAHGFFNAKDAYIFREIAKALTANYDVIAFDFRGHGKSSGLFTWTARECADLRCVIAYVKKCKYESIGLMGFSLGAAISLIETAQNPDIKTVIAVSAPYDLWKIDFHFWEAGMLDDLKLNLGYKAKGKGIRPSHPWEPKVAPIDIVGNISPRPVLFIHGAEDWLIKPDHSRQLYNKAKEPKKIIILEKAGHAETIFDQDRDLLMKPCLNWFKDTL
ncbi:MAG: alpha/beta fold hydrolase [Candidatus Omnitrophica bacterium]|nr:alpha/beta fold hydrolase [Candidatus Omnitrophota bacterium]